MVHEWSREDFERGMASADWREAVGRVAFELLKTNRTVGEAIERFAQSEREGSATAYRLSRGVFWLTCAIATAAALQGLQSLLTLWALLSGTAGVSAPP